MAEGLGPDAADGVLGAVCLGISFVLTDIEVQLHVGPPGAAGTSSVAVNSTRVGVTGVFAKTASGQVDNSTEVDQSASAPATEVYTHWSMWSGSMFVLSGLVAGDASVTAGDPVTFKPHTLVVSLPLAS